MNDAKRRLPTAARKSEGRSARTQPASGFEQFWTGATYLYLLRVPLAAWVILVSLPFLALPPEAAFGPLLRGLFDVADTERGWQWLTYLLVTLTSFLAATTIAITARLVLWDGGERFGIPDAPRSPGVNLVLRIVPAVGAISIVAGTWLQSVSVSGPLSAVVGTAAGFAIFYLMMTVVHRWLWDQVFPEFAQLYAASFVGSEAASVRLPRGLSGALADGLAWLLRMFELLIRRTPSGFFGADENMWARHVFAFFQFQFSLVVYVALFFIKWYPFSGSTAPRIPTLSLLLVLIMLLCWGLAGLTFLLDRFRVPVLSLLVLYGTLVAVFPQSDHYYQSIPTPAGSAASPTAGALLARRSGQRAIVVAATGGGIQAAAWTARALVGLQKDAQACGTEFDRAIVAISAVSGGSVGAMYVIDSYSGGRMPSVDNIDENVVVKAASASSLDEIAFGIAYPDFFWSLFPFLKGLSIVPPALVNGPNLTSDRGSALEDTWKRSGTTLADAKLSGWRNDVAQNPPVRPAVMFNATIAETGERMILGTTGFDDDAIGRREFVHEYPAFDVPVTTAARMSATFPYISPAARILRRGVFENEFHLVDGGYYDNYGTASLIEWIAQGLRSANGAVPSEILLLQLRSSPPAARILPPGSRGWTYSLLQPLGTLFRVRDAGQLSHSDVDVDLTAAPAAYIVAPALGSATPRVTSVVIQFPGPEPGDAAAVQPPLSWHLTPADRGALQRAWGRVRDGRIQVSRFLGAIDAERCVE